MLELCLGTIHDYSRGIYDGQVPEPKAGLRQMVDGLNYIHSSGLIHGRLKPENILIFSPDVLKLSDFGLTGPVPPQSSFSSSGSMESPSCKAPEVILAEEDETQLDRLHDTTAGDLFALGCVMYTFLTRGGHPFISPGGRHYSAVLNILQAQSSLDGECFKSFMFRSNYLVIA